MVQDISSKTAPALFVALLSAYIIFPGLGASSLRSWDEAEIAQISREIVESGDWLTLHFMGEPWFKKPPLYFWLTALTYKFFGVSEFSARLWSAVFGVGCSVVTYLLASRLYGTRVGLLSSIILISCSEFILGHIHGARMVALDTAVTFFILLSFFSYLSARSEKRYFILFGVSLGLGFMAKSFVGLIPLPVVVAHLLLSGRLSDVRSKEFLLGAAVFVGLIAPWQIHALMEGGESVKEALVFELFERVRTPIEGHHGDLFFYPRAILAGFYPFSVFSFFGLVYALRKAGSGDKLLLVWSAFIFIVFSVIQTKLWWYMIPLYPALSIVCARFLFDYVLRRQGVVLMFLALLSYFTVNYGGSFAAGLGGGLLFAVFLVYGDVWFSKVFSRRGFNVSPLFSIFLVAVLLSTLQGVYNLRESVWVSGREEVYGYLAENPPPSKTVVVYDMGLYPSLYFYLADIPGFNVFESNDILAAPATEGVLFLTTRDKYIKSQERYFVREVFSHENYVLFEVERYERTSGCGVVR